jgi:hypothetical protein
MDNLKQHSIIECGAEIPQYFAFRGISKFKPSQTNIKANPLYLLLGIKGLGAKIPKNNLIRCLVVSTA